MKKVALSLVVFGVAWSFSLHGVDAPQVRIRVVKPLVVVAEPVVVDAWFTGIREFVTEPLGEKRPQYLRLLIDRGQGVQSYVPQRFASEWADRIPLPTKRHHTEYVVTWDVTTSDWAFPRPGQYRIAVEYRDPEAGLLRSNEVTLRVVAPEGGEARAFAELPRYRSELLLRETPMPLGDALAPMVREFPQSVYVQRARLADLQHRFERAGEGCEASGPCAVLPQEERERRAPVLLRELLPHASELAEVGGPFQPEVMLIQARILQCIGQQAAGQELLRRIMSDHTQRVVADRAPLFMDSTK